MDLSRSPIGTAFFVVVCGFIFDMFVEVYIYKTNQVLFPNPASFIDLEILPDLSCTLIDKHIADETETKNYNTRQGNRENVVIYALEPYLHRL